MCVVSRYEDGYPLEHQHLRGSSEATAIYIMIDRDGSCKYVLYLIVPHALSEAPGGRSRSGPRAGAAVCARHQHDDGPRGCARWLCAIASVVREGAKGSVMGFYHNICVLVTGRVS